MISSPNRLILPVVSQILVGQRIKTIAVRMPYVCFELKFVLDVSPEFAPKIAFRASIPVAGCTQPFPGNIFCHSKLPFISFSSLLISSQSLFILHSIFPFLFASCLVCQEAEFFRFRFHPFGFFYVSKQSKFSSKQCCKPFTCHSGITIHYLSHPMFF